MNYKKILIGLLSTLVYSNVNAQTDKQNADSVIYSELETVEVKGVKVGAVAPFSITNIDKITLQKNNSGQDIPYFIDQTPSVLVNSDAGTGIGYSDMRIRGTDNQRINLTINGIPVNDPESQGSFFVNFPDLMSSASSVQIQRGVGSSTNGSGAFGASIHISNLKQKEDAHFTAINGIGSYNTFRHSLMAGTGLLKGGFTFDMRLSKISSDGYIDRSYSDLKSLHFLAGWRSYDGRTNAKFNLFTGKEKTGQAWNGVSQEVLDTNRVFNELGKMENGKYYDDQSDNYQQDYYQFFLNHYFKNNITANLALFYTKGRGYYNEYRLDEKFSSYNLPNVIYGNDTVTNTSLVRQLWLDNHYYGAIGSITYQKARTRIDAGLGMTNYLGDHFGKVKWANIGVPYDHEFYNNNARKSEFNTYVKWEQEIYKNLFSFIDLQFRKVNYNINGFRKSPDVKHALDFAFFNPKVGISYLKNDAKYFVSFARAAKEPNRNDFESGVEQKPSPEILNDLEIGYELNKSRYNLGVNLYWMQYTNQLINTGKINDVGAYTRVNVPNSYRRGIELFGRYKVLNNLILNANITLSQNKIKKYNEYIDDFDLGVQIAKEYNNTDIALSPSFIGGHSIEYIALSKIGKYQLSFELLSKWVGKQYLDNTQDNAKSIKPYNVHNLRINFDLMTSWSKTLQLSLMINNILDKKYESKGYTYSYIYGGMNTFNYYYPQAGRNFMLNFTIGI